MSKTLNSKGKVEAIDGYVGNKLRARRILLGLSQQEVGDAVNVSVQQIQKYERADNRISCSKIYRLSKLLNVPVSYFFDFSEEALNERYPHSLAESQDIFKHDNPQDSNIEKEILSLVKTFKEISSQPIRQKVIELVKAMSDK